MTTVETVETAGMKTARNAAKKIGHRYQPGHPFHPRKHGSQSQAAVFKRRSCKILAAIVAERGGELSVTQLIHAKNAADLGAAIMEMKDQKKDGKFVDLITISNLVNAQRRSLEELDR